MLNTNPPGFPQASGKAEVPDITHQLMTLNNPSIDQIVEVLLTWSYDRLGSEEIVAATDEFHQLSGKVFPDDPFYEQRISYFFDHFLFERPLGRDRFLQPTTPFQLFCQEVVAAMDPPETLRSRLDQLAGARHSAFEIARAEEGFLVVRNLFNRDKFRIVPKDQELYHGFTRKQVFQAFVFPKEEGVTAHMSDGIVLHPQSVTKILKKHLKAASKRVQNPNPHTILYRWARQQIRYKRHSHVQAELIYSQNPR